MPACVQGTALPAFDCSFISHPCKPPWHCSAWKSVFIPGRSIQSTPSAVLGAACHPSTTFGITNAMSCSHTMTISGNIWQLMFHTDPSFAVLGRAAMEKGCVEFRSQTGWGTCGPNVDYFNHMGVTCDIAFCVTDMYVGIVEVDSVQDMVIWSLGSKDGFMC